MSAGTKTKVSKPMMRAAAKTVSKRPPASEKQGSADYVLSVRKKLGMTQEQFAKFLGVGYSTVYQWEQGYRKPEPLAIGMVVLAEVSPKLLKDTLKRRLDAAIAMR